MDTEEIAPGVVIDGLRIDAIAGRGGFSVVYRATDLSSGRPLAMKVLSRTDPSSRRLLAREAELLATVSHPAIVPFRGFRQTKDHDILITDWVEGESLHRRLQRTGPLSVEQALAVLRAVAPPLDHLHRMDIVHRDISPSNVIIGSNGSLTLIDLGIGHHVESSTLTRDDLLAGTPKYLAPEVIRGERADGRADQYSVGVMIHELLTGQSPFPATNKVATALHHQLHSVPVPLDEIDPRVPTDLAEAVLRSLQKEPTDRFDSVSEFAAVATTGRSRPDESEGGVRRSRRARLVLACLGLGAMVVFGALAANRILGDRNDVALGQGGGSETASPARTPAVEAQADALVTEGTVAELEVPDNPDDPVLPGPGWLDGTAATLACNRLAGSDFGNGSVPTDYFGDPPGRERVAVDVGYAGSWGLEVGRAGAFGQYGEIIPIQPGEVYSFVGWFDRIGQIADTEMGISFLTEDYQPLSAGAAIDTPAERGRFAGVVAVPAPEGAGFAVPYVFKDGSEGVLMADELIFGVADQCRSEIEALNG